ncbi:histidine--tRNA ligase [Aquipuribacter nitratireducens]|uniref:Histidine--tRNA ligase n=1 Tax=Aquipuribacter nitratireducens TaxID=650104 RepID=A0ABW0GSA8_9MICO
MARIAPLSGFPEWLPAERAVEVHVVDTLRRVFELHGFAGIETRSVEPLSQMLRKGEIDKEVYVVRRLHADEPGDAGAPDDDTLGLHFDLTVPLARYVLQNAGHLVFPFKRYQIQRSWRGERPQDGRFREFVQADVDVVGRDTLPRHHEVDVPLVMVEALRALDVGDVRMRVNDRRVAEGLVRGLGLDDVPPVLAAVDKLAKIGPDAVGDLLRERAGASAAQVDAVLEMAGVSGPGAARALTDLVARHGAGSDALHEAVGDLQRLLDAAEEVAPGAVVADLSVVRGLDYYTGSVYETELVGQEDLGSVCSGGRYDDLASDGATRHPGVGLSIGVSRLVSRLLRDDVVRASRPVPTAVLVAVSDEATRSRSDAVARALRARGIPSDTAPTAAKFGRQIRHADRLGVPFVWFPGAAGDPDEVKDIRSGDQVVADAATWEPPSADRYQQVVPVHHP